MGTLTPGMTINRKGLDKVIATQIEAGLLPPDAATSCEAYVDGHCLDEARAGKGR